VDLELKFHSLTWPFNVNQDDNMVIPMFCHSGNLSNLNLNLYLPEVTENSIAHGLILNAFDDLQMI
jgi:hypothetical protein